MAGGQLASRICTTRAICFPDSDRAQFTAALANRRLEPDEADLCDVLDRWVHTAGVLLELGGIDIQVGVVECINDARLGEPGEVGLCECGRWIDRDSRLDLVVVSMPRGVVALAKAFSVLVIAQRRDVQSVGRGEVETLAENHFGRVRHLDAPGVEGAQSPGEPFEADGQGLGHSASERLKQFGGVGCR